MADEPCRWPLCPAPAVAIDVHGDRWCAEHLAWEGPELEYGLLRACVICDQLTCGWLGTVPLHDRCTRAHAMGAVSLKPVGAYARRRRG